MQQHEFDLTDDQWILAQNRDGQVREASILDVFEHAHELTTIVGELPTVGYATFRLLLAILHRAVDGPEHARAWQDLWKCPTLPIDVIRAYLEQHRSRFDLLHPETPFFQVADLRTAKGEVSGLEKLIADVPNGERYFTTRSGSGVNTIGYAEAARWLVHCQAFDPSGIKSGAVGDPRVKGGRGYPIGVAWTGNIGGLYLERNSLRETLLLNLVPHSHLGLDREIDLPPWERPPSTACASDGRRPQGPVDHYTWQSRRVRLFHDGERVTGVLIANGDPCTVQDRFRTEPLTAWRFSEAQQKKLKTENPVYMPREHLPARALWRGLNALLADATPSGTSQGPARWLPPKNLDWIATLTEEGRLDPDVVVRAHAVGMTYGSMQSVVTDVVDDAVTMSVALLRERSRELGRTAVDATAAAGAGARALGQLAGNIAAAAGGEALGPRDRARELAYDELDARFRRWVARLGPDTDPYAARRAWHEEAERVIRRLGSGLAERAGPTAWVGREINNRHMSSPEADALFRRQLRAAVPLAYEPPDEIAS